MGDAGELEPGLKSDDRAGGVAGAAADLDLAPAGLASHANDDALVEDLDPAGAVLGLVGAAVEADDFGAAQAAGEADQQDGAVAQAAQVTSRASRSSPADLRRSTASFWSGGRPWLAADAAHHLGDMAIGAVERLAALGTTPGDAPRAAVRLCAPR